MISIQNYQDFLTKINSLDQDIRVKLICILNKRLEGRLPKKYMFSYQKKYKYDYTYELDENLIPFLNIFDEYFYPEKLLDHKIYNEISYNLDKLYEIYTICKNLDNNSFKNISETMLFFGNIGDSLYDTHKQIQTIFLKNKKDILIDILLKYFTMIDFNTINSIVENSTDISDFFNKIEYKINEKITNDMKDTNDTQKNLSIIQWYIFSNEMKFLDKINIIEYKIHNIIYNLSIKLDSSLKVENVYLRSHEFSNNQIFEEKFN